MENNQRKERTGKITILKYNWKEDPKTVEPPYLWFNAYTGEYFRSYFTKNYYQSLFVYQIN